MKSLKLDHELAHFVLKGEKTSTWRLYDDKDLSVNDDVRLIDKVDPKNPATWKPIGTAHITMIIQKRLGDLEDVDYEGHERFTTKGELLKTYQTYYGPQVTFDTPVKIVRFVFDSKGNNIDEVVANKSTYIKEVKLYSDGGSRGNPGPSAAGYVIMTMDNQIVVKKAMYLGVTTSNQAEYQALKSGLEEALKMRVREVHVYMDSLLVVNQMLGIFKVKNRDLWPIHESIKELLARFKHVSFTHVPRELNKIADGAVNEALDEALR
ncbi:MAG TPA: reverse transcriptase-like protein [Candidatus Saccharimonadales bacterium]|nr:reverse transcriptase-like protein [Candidatus Saccharimonadales bacterium]